MNILDLSQSTFIALETFRKNGTGIVTPVWVTGEDGKLYVWTNEDSWKVKRIYNNHQVRVCESDARGNPKNEWIEATAKVLASENDLNIARKRFKSKYGFQFQMFSLMGRKDPKVVIEINSL